MFAQKHPFTSVLVGGSADPEKNASLAAVLKRVKSQNVPKENVEKALAKVHIEENCWEGT